MNTTQCHVENGTEVGKNPFQSIKIGSVSEFNFKFKCRSWGSIKRTMRACFSKLIKELHVGSIYLFTAFHFHLPA